MKYIALALLAALAGCQSAPIDPVTLEARNYCFARYGGPANTNYDYCVYARQMGMRPVGPARFGFSDN
ncbi:hypothetical protein [Mycoplana ramosa]|uniref:Lipoprotein n=1 Tax=Mycoplana ramosa TaxID=40837 RepID=A0ABW3YZY2_MYCRA